MEKKESEKKTLNFIRRIIEDDIRENRIEKVITRFPPEPNGYLHVGHTKAICLSFGIAESYNGRCNLRFDDSNPAKEKQEYIDSIKEDIRWLGFDWKDHCYYASDYFDKLYEWAVKLIKEGGAYVDDSAPEEITRMRGKPEEKGTESPYRNRPVDENLKLFEGMKNGEYDEGARVLRAKIDMSAPNTYLRDPVIYRIINKSHPRTGNKWSIYPTYDFTHGQSDYIEGVTHSLCTLEFEEHRPLYDWFLDHLYEGGQRPRQIEFARLNLTYTVVSKRYLLKLVEEGYVDGWDDPRMPTVCGMRRRGFPPQAIRNFCEHIGIAKRDSVVDKALLEYFVREYLNKVALRVMAVLKPLKVVITNYPEGESEKLDAVNNPERPEDGNRKVPFSRELYIEREDFMEDPPKKFFRLAPGREVRLRNADFIKCEEAVKDPETGEITELRCTYDPQTRGGDAPDGRKVKATLHWVSAEHALKREVRLYDRLFKTENPMKGEEGKNCTSNLNPESVEVVKEAMIEPSMENAEPEKYYQFERKGYFCVDSKEYEKGNSVFNRTVTLRDRWKNIKKKK